MIAHFKIIFLKLCNLHVDIIFLKIIMTQSDARLDYYVKAY